MEEQVATDLIKGGHLRIRKDKELLYDKCFGYADAENGKKIRPDTIYRMYSMTKPVTAVASMIALDLGLFSLEDPVEKYLEGFHNQKVLTPQGLVATNRPSRMEDLLTMTAGLVYPDMWSDAQKAMCTVFDRFYRDYANGITTGTVDMCNAIGRSPLAWQPGETWEYSTGADILAGVIEVASGMKYSSFLHRYILDPLGMKDTEFYVPEEKRDRFAQIYIRDESGKLKVCTMEHLGICGQYRNPPAFEIGGAGLVSTMDDYDRFSQMLLHRGICADNGKRIVSEAGIDWISQDRLKPSQKKTFNWDSCEGYGYGGLMRVLLDPELSVAGNVGEFGWDGWTGNYFYVDPKENITFLYMIQTACTNGPKPIQALKKILYEEIAK